MKPLVVIRPEPGCAASLAEARRLGLDAHGFPLFVVGPVAWDAPPVDSCDALLIGSANALRHAGPALDRFRGKPAYVVGPTTAAAARAAGIVVIVTADGGLQEVLAQMEPGHRRLLRLAGRKRTVLEPPPGVAIEERVVYDSVAQPFPAALAGLLDAGAVVLLHSGEAARHFARGCDGLGLDRAKITLAALAPGVARAAGSGWAAVGIAPVPRDPALLALAAQMCQTAA